MKIATLITFLLLLTLTSCKKENPSPELNDEIYQDLTQELAVATKNLESEEKNFEKVKHELLNVAPQTGQIKFAQRKVTETENNIIKLRQQKQFFEIKLELRKDDIRARYLESFKKGKPFNNDKEIEDYRAVIKFQRDKLAWEKNKGTKKNVPHGTEKKAAQEAHH